MFGLLRTLTSAEKKHWPRLLLELVFWYNTTAHSTTGHSPHLLLFGREPRLPIDDFVESGRDHTPSSTAEDYLRSHRQRLGKLHRLIQDRIDQCQSYKTPQLRSTQFKPGDQVLIRNRPAERNKIQDRCGPDIYLVENSLTGSQKFVAASEIRRYQRQAIHLSAEPRPELTVTADDHLTHRVLPPRERRPRSRLSGIKLKDSCRFI
ncbi:hypothetical protein RRG08_026530 [Elysia crispata]|uniref:Integrase catalytic domain-containing protein n=1 Tax=Elysia crispata TaxID=231223 RepID=A0AAE1CSB7_9GAST|nr:hypothetical protein RRG08_026530 [Elysia crispata]